MRYKIALLGGDGVGPAIIDEGVKTLNAIERKFGIKFEYEKALIGGCAYDDCGYPLPESTLSIAKDADAVFLGAVGDWKYDTLPPEVRPEKALLGIRKALNLFANLRPVTVFDELTEASTLKPEVVKGVDIMIVRELTGDVYFGQPRGIQEINGERAGFNNMIYFEKEIERVAHVAFQTAQKRNKKLCSVDKANVLDASRLWREIVTAVSDSYPDVELTHMYVDNAAMQLIRNPKQFDVIVTGNIFGDILSDEASMISGSLGMLPSASLSNHQKGLFEPIHGSAPDLKGKNVVNPIATILSAAMMMRYSFGLDDAALLIENAVKSILKKGYRTQDIYNATQKEQTLVGTTGMGDLIYNEILNL